MLFIIIILIVCVLLIVWAAYSMDDSEKRTEEMRCMVKERNQSIRNFIEVATIDVNGVPMIKKEDLLYLINTLVKGFK